MKRAVSLAVFSAVFFMLVSAPFSVFAAGVIKVGIVDCYSGPPGVYTHDVRDAFGLVADKVNRSGGVFGKKIVFVTRDSKFKVDIGLSAAKELIMRENVDLLMGTINSALALAISDLAKKEKIPFLVTFAKSAKITGAKGHRYVFSVTENTAMAGKAGAAGLAEKPFVKYWIAGDDYEYGHSLADAVWKNLKKMRPDATLMGQSWWKVGEPDFTPYITAILSADPDALVVATGGRDCVPFLKAAKATGLNKRIPFYMHTATELSTLKPLGLNAPEGVIGTANYHYDADVLDTPANRAFVKEFKDAFGREPAVGALYGHIAGSFVAAAYQKAGKADPERFIDALEGMSVDSPVGRVTMRAYDHQAALPMFMGVTRKAAGKPRLVAADIVVIPGQKALPSIEEIKKSRER
ncbi:Amino acid/amide ABC transporter substrate-binding protein, HAAT family [Candidatus Desulfarcum epimagneticum]|uniref:Amino acid/amide ABC transporter substrate-binding protein, HAAT family n=1 Tax=uncultured Desulfobacteraceae bacterium TaxID=218296 RepID=A0A484HFA4_9BACT|nr:Amino acid/amide ABC transporter substrate-binding protein, HAAT family [uncultured Desulfobacteraceae bacterium]